MEKERSKNNRTIISSELLSDNTLLLISRENEGNTLVSICYMANEYSKKFLKEDLIAKLDGKTFIKRNDQMIAVFKETNYLGIKIQFISKVYDLSYHKFVGEDMLNAIYDIRTKDDPKVKQLLNKGGILTWQTI